MTVIALAAEWDRIEKLCEIVSRGRDNAEATEADLLALQSVQDKVINGRQMGAWDHITGSALDPMEYDILAACLAPHLSPRINWLYRNLQGVKSHKIENSVNPRILFLQELYSLMPADMAAINKAMSPNSRLIKSGLVSLRGDGLERTFMPMPGLVERLLGIDYTPSPPPGTSQVNLRAGWDDLVLPSNLITRLKEYIAYVTHREVITREWGGNPIGGPVALFSGPSGTGKTFAASVIATEIGWPLFRVDLGRLVSKYIGETEKNFNALFNAANNQNMILQFDEADALFARRGEVKDARDRYANLEVSHLLSRIESHHGPCILTTNMRDQMDTAFARRFHMVVDFPRPDKAAREALWKRHIPPLAPKDASLDISLLASSVKLNGGSIRNAATHAAVIAANTNQALSLEHVAISAWRELGKEGRPLSRSEIGELAHLLEGAGI